MSARQVMGTLWAITPFKTVVRPVARRVRGAGWAPWNWTRTLRVCRILVFEFGHLRSVVEGASIDRDGQPIPWFTYPAIEYLGRLDLSTKRVFEYGCGNSTRYWGRRAHSVVSVEHVPEYHALISPELPPNCELLLMRPAERYVNAIADYCAREGGRGFDIIVIDGHSRVRCAAIAREYLAPGGVVILDNSDWFPEAVVHLRAAGLLESSFSGFTPINDCTQTTSFFFDRTFNFAWLPNSGGGIGSVPKPAFAKVP